MKYLLIFVLYLLNLYLIYDTFCVDEDVIEYYTNKEYNIIHETLYNNIKKSIDIFEKYNIKYWATAGTLLGCIRDKKIIEHDDYIDLGMNEKDYNRLSKCIKEENELFQEFKKAGLHVVEKFPGKLIKILTHREDGDYNKNKIFIDIINYEKKDNKYESVEEGWKHTEWYNCDDIDNLSTGVLKDIEIKIPNNYISYLERTYGDCSKDRCWKIPKKEHDHEDEVNLEKNVMNLFDNTYYINLEKRKDRKMETIRELNNFGIKNPIRFDAIKDYNGAIGCSKSHLSILKKARDNKYPYVAIFEDDVKFIDVDETYTKLNKLLNSNIEWDVVLLGGNNFKPYDILDESIYRVKNCQTTTSYIVKQKYYDTLINHWERGLQKLIETNDDSKYALDQYWKELQKKDKFLLIVPVKVIQRKDYSDIQKGHVDYEGIMKDYK
uniref:Glycosyltransferase n=1 Tax=viral metagenome TaxID=1070528 RepID=A0A6C0CWJ0_9ZZZZ